MDKIQLSKREKEVFRMLSNGQDTCPPSYPLHEFNLAVDSLCRHGFAVAQWQEGHVVMAARLTPLGHQYLAEHPRLDNPINWTIVGIVIGAITAIGTILGTILAVFVVFSVKFAAN